MDGGVALDLAREAILVMVRISMPLLMATLVIGIVISLVQALTQIQEMTLTFIPKMLVLFVTFLLMLPYISRQMKGFTNLLFQQIETLS